MDSTSETSEPEALRIIGLTEADLLKIKDPDSVWLVHPFERGVGEPIAAFTEFTCAVKLASRLNALIGNGIGKQTMPKDLANIELDRYRQLTDVVMTPFLIHLQVGETNWK
jgi:hypothetical protein